MKRNYVIWLMLVLIVFLGFGLTAVTRQIVSRPAPLVTAVQDTQAVDGEIETEMDAGAVISEAAGATVAIPPVAITPIDSAAASADPGTEKTQMELRLEELEDQIAVYRSQTAQQESTANTMKVDAEYELGLWETEMDALIIALSDRMDEEAYLQFQKEQQIWSRERESKAMEISRRYAGSTLESVEYTRSMAVQTRSRVYAVAAEYY